MTGSNHRDNALEMERLQQIDKDSQSNLYRHTIDDILKQGNRPDNRVEENDYDR